MTQGRGTSPGSLIVMDTGRQFAVKESPEEVIETLRGAFGRFAVTSGSGIVYVHAARVIHVEPRPQVKE